MNRFFSLSVTLVLILTLAGCGAGTAVPTQPETTPAPSAELTEEPLESTASAVTSEPVQTGLFAEQIFSGADGDIHYSYYLPDSYDGSRKFPMMVVMPGYNMMWFGEDSSGSNLNWSGFTAWTRLDTEMVVVTAQLTDWGEKSARQAIELTEYFINSFAVDTSRVYAAGYSAGGETMSRAVAMRPDLYAAYLHGASQWDGSYAPIAENVQEKYGFKVHTAYIAEVKRMVGLDIMASNYKFSKEEMAAIKAARRETKDKRADARLKALELRAEGMELSEVSQATGFHAAYVSQLVAKYRDHGLEAISGNHYGGNHRNMSFEEEAAILAPFKARAEKGELVEISEIETAYQQAVGHSIGTSQIYYVLHRHGWRKVMPRSRHPKKASEEVIETSKKLKPPSVN